MTEPVIFPRSTNLVKRKIIYLCRIAARFFLNRLIKKQQENQKLQLKERIRYLSSIVHLLENIATLPVIPPEPVSLPQKKPMPTRARTLPDAIATGSALLNTGQSAQAWEWIRPLLSELPPSAELLNLAALCHIKLDRLEQAILCWEEALRIQPHYADALINQGIAFLKHHRVDEAMTALQRALTVQPDDATIHCHLGRAMQKQKRADDAEASYRRALAIDPQSALAHALLGQHLKRQKRMEDATTCYQQALIRTPDDADLHCDLGALFLEREMLTDAEHHLREGVELQPDHAGAWNNLGILLSRQKKSAEAEKAFLQALHANPDDAEVCFNLGTLLMKEKYFSEAEKFLTRALDGQPDRIETLENLGYVQTKLHQFEASEKCYQKLLQIKPEHADAFVGIGNLMRAQYRMEDAERAYKQALRVLPDHPHALNNLAHIWCDSEHHHDAEIALLHLITIKPNFVEAKGNLAYLYLSLGRFREGWPLYEARYDPNFDERSVFLIDAPFPMWRGEDLRGKSLLIIPEQGFGDQMQFCRFAPMLKAQGVAKITLQCHPLLLDLLTSLPGIDRLQVNECGHIATKHDFWTFYGSIPLHLEITLSTIPATIPYLRPPEERRTYWQGRIPARPFRVGLVWKGNPKHINDYYRSMPGLATLSPLWSIPGIRFISLQKMRGEEEVNPPSEEQPLLPLGHLLRDFADTAAVIEQLDLVITVDSSVAHLAGALGKSCWVLLPFSADWRWLRHREDSPWYPVGMRLFRQPRPGDWLGLVAQVTEELNQMVQLRLGA
ncbi:MAG: tetratricopeptide repeat protein [Magnetococcales bacterium]|nr:tetratricopeptide repeat protein [Magnetococcales bacterium]